MTAAVLQQGRAIGPVGSALRAMLSFRSLPVEAVSATKGTSEKAASAVLKERAREAQITVEQI